MIAKVIVDVASKSVDYKFDYIIPEQLESAHPTWCACDCTFLDQERFKVM